MDDDDRWSQDVRDHYARPVSDEEGARARVMARVRRERDAAGRVLRLSPLAAAASIAVVLALGAAGGAAWMNARIDRRPAVSRRPDVPPIAVPAGDQPTAVTFVFRAPGASRVALVGDFNGWDPDATPLRRAALGDAWTAEVPLHQGLHVYAFVIDGREWTPDPSAPLTPASSYGRRNSVVVVGEGGAL